MQTVNSGSTEEQRKEKKKKKKRREKRAVDVMCAWLIYSVVIIPHVHFETLFLLVSVPCQWFLEDMLSTVYILMLNLRRMYQFNLFTAQDFALLVQFSIHCTYFNPEFKDNVSVNLFAAQDFALLVQFSSQDSFKNLSLIHI